MSYTDVGKVAGMFPTFARGGANQKQTDSLIQQYLDDVTAEINAVLDRRFAESIAAPPSSGSVSAWLVAMGMEASNILEKLNRFGCAALLGETQATLGITGVREMA